MKKVLALVCVATVLCLAGSVYAETRPVPARQNITANQPAPRPQRPRPPLFTPDMPKEIREKVAEMAKLKIDLEEALSSKPVNKEKAFDVHAKIQKLGLEIEDWKFKKKVERIEVERIEAAQKRQEQRHRNRRNTAPAAAENQAPKPAENPSPANDTEVNTH